MLTYKELQGQILELRKQAELARRVEQAEVLEKIRSLILEYQLLPADLGFTIKGTGRSAGSIEARYRDPISGKTWSGRGRKPLWLQGDDRSKYEI